MTRPISSRRISGTFEAHTSLSARDQAYLVRLGVRPEIVEQVTNCLRVARVIWLPTGRFLFEEHLPASQLDVGGERAFLILVEASDGQSIDIVAWDPATARLAAWLGEAWALGQGALLQRQAQEGGALSIWRTPQAWLNAGQRGLVLIQSRAAVQPLRGASALIAEDVSHGRELKCLTDSAGPRILIPANATGSDA